MQSDLYQRRTYIDLHAPIQQLMDADTGILATVSHDLPGLLLSERFVASVMLRILVMQ